MAIGDYGTNSRSNRGGVYEPTYYSRMRINAMNDRMIKVTYRSGLMILEINNVVDGFKTEPVIAIYLSPNKAMMLASQITEYLNYRAGDKIDPNKAFGVNAGMNEKITYIAFSTNKDKDIIITIGKFDGNGVIVESESVTMNKSYNYSLEWDNLSKNDLTKVYNDELEVIVIKNAVEDFGRYMSGASGYAALDLNRFNHGHFDRKFDEIFDKLGIERSVPHSGGGRNYQQNNFLNNSSSKTTSFEEVEDLLV